MIDLDDVANLAERTPGSPDKKSTIKPESSAMVGEPEILAVLRAFSMAFSTNVLCGSCGDWIPFDSIVSNSR